MIYQNQMEQKKKLLDIKLAKKYGWKPKIDLKKSIINTYKSFFKKE
jgi:nucleoside-diphosphate-sugar epimerase